MAAAGVGTCLLGGAATTPVEAQSVAGAEALAAVVEGVGTQALVQVRQDASVISVISQQVVVEVVAPRGAQRAGTGLCW